MKLKMVVIDDEVFVRKGIISGINWASHGIEIVGEAPDGRSGLELIRKTKPHIVLTDIRMPIMDGMELVRKVSNEFPETKILILSVLEEFEKVREALQFGVMDYVPKLSMTPEELLDSVMKIKKQFQVETEWRSQQSIPPGEDLDAEMEELLQETARYVVAKVRCTQETQDFSTGASPYQKLVRWLQEIEYEPVKSLYVYQRSDDYWLLVFLADEQCDHTELSEAIHHKLMQHKQAGLKIAMGFSTVFAQSDMKKEAIDQASLALERHFFHKNDACQVYLYEPHDTQEAGARCLQLNNFHQYFIDLGQNDQELLEKAFSQLFPIRIEETYAQEQVRAEIYQWVSNLSIYIKDRGGLLSSALGNTSPFEQLSELHTYVEIRDWCYRLHKVAISMLETLKGSQRLEVVKAMDYMRSHLHRPLRVKEVADAVHLSENYFSYIFTKETGKTFSQYLQELRIENAKKLLEARQMSWIAAGEQSGFENPKYFTKIFKKLNGVTPKQYADSKRW